MTPHPIGATSLGVLKALECCCAETMCHAGIVDVLLHVCSRTASHSDIPDSAWYDVLHQIHRVHF